MAANSGVKIVRDFLRDSPCRMAYMMTQQKNFTQQYARNRHLGKSAPQERPKTAPVPPPSNLAQAITNHNLMPESVVAPPKRPRTSARLVKPNMELMSTDGLLATASRRPPQKPIRRPEVPPLRPRRPSEQIRKRPSGTSGEDVRKRQQKQSSSSKHHDRNPPKRPCKICIDGEECFAPEQQQPWQDLLDVTPSSSSSKSGNGFRHLIGEIERIRSELTSRNDMKHIGLQQSLELINEIKQRFDSVRAASGGASYLSRLEPFQTADRRIKPRKSIRSLRFEGGRIVEKDYAQIHHNRGGEVLKVKKSKLKQVEKKFDEGPLRMLLPFMRGSLKAEKVRF